MGSRSALCSLANVALSSPSFERAHPYRLSSGGVQTPAITQERYSWTVVGISEILKEETFRASLNRRSATPTATSAPWILTLVGTKSGGGGVGPACRVSPDPSHAFKAPIRSGTKT